MRLKVRAHDSEVVQIAISKRQPCQNPVHHPLETAACILETKGYAKKVEEAKPSNNGRLKPVFRPHRDLPVALPEVDFTCGIPEAHTCVLQVAVRAGAPQQRQVLRGQ